MNEQEWDASSNNTQKIIYQHKPIFLIDFHSFYWHKRTAAKKVKTIAEYSLKMDEFSVICLLEVVERRILKYTDMVSNNNYYDDR